MSLAVALLVTFVLGHVVGRRAAIRHCAQLLRDACHLDAANLIDPGKDRP